MGGWGDCLLPLTLSRSNRRGLPRAREAKSSQVCSDSLRTSGAGTLQQQKWPSVRPLHSVDDQPLCPTLATIMKISSAIASFCALGLGYPPTCLIPICSMPTFATQPFLVFHCPSWTGLSHPAHISPAAFPLNMETVCVCVLLQ